MIDGSKSRLPKACVTPLKLTKEIKVLAILASAAPCNPGDTLSSWLLENMTFVRSAGSRFSFRGLPNFSGRPSLAEAELGLVVGMGPLQWWP